MCEAPNSLPTTSLSDFNVRLMWIRDRTSWKRPALLLVVPWGMVHTLKTKNKIRGNFRLNVPCPRCKTTIQHNTGSGTKIPYFN